MQAEDPEPKAKDHKLKLPVSPSPRKRTPIRPLRKTPHFAALKENEDPNRSVAQLEGKFKILSKPAQGDQKPQNKETNEDGKDKTKIEVNLSKKRVREFKFSFGLTRMKGSPLKPKEEFKSEDKESSQETQSLLLGTPKFGGKDSLAAE